MILKNKKGEREKGYNDKTSRVCEIVTTGGGVGQKECPYSVFVTKLLMINVKTTCHSCYYVSILTYGEVLLWSKPTKVLVIV